MPIKLIKREIRKNPKVHTGNEHWSQAQKMEAVTTYLLLGNWVQTAATLKIPIDTLKKWKQADWWKEMELEIRHQSNVKVGGKLQRIIDKTTDIVMDRLEHGDIAMDKDGNVVRRPVNARTASEIMTKSIDKDILLQKLEKEPEIKTEGVIERLKSIQEQLRKNTKKPQLEIIDVTPESEETHVEELSNVERP